MTLTLHVDTDAWEAHVQSVADRYGDVIAVVKGNGYGFGLGRLAGAAVRFGFGALAVGTVHELASLPPFVEAPIVLTPMGAADRLCRDAVLTVGSVAHVDVLARAGLAPPVVVKLASSMRRYGAEPDALPELLTAAERAGLEVRQFALHLPLAGEAAEVEPWLTRLPNDTPLSVSHLDATALTRLRDAHPRRRIVARLGTVLWHGDKSFLALRADVLDARPTGAGKRAGYRLAPVPTDGTLVMVGAGTAHGVHPLADGRSPFHFARSRLALIEPPHMHTSVVIVPASDPVPALGGEVDVQQPLTFVRVDRVAER
jgi:alanine racemase